MRLNFYLSPPAAVAAIETAVADITGWKDALPASQMKKKDAR